MRFPNDPKVGVILLTGLLMASCATVAPKSVKVTPPMTFMVDCPEPEVDTATNGGLAKGITDLRGALRLCNNDKAALREWAKE